MDQCPVCKLNNVHVSSVSGSGGGHFTVVCARCGKYRIGKMARFRLENQPLGNTNALLSGWLRRQQLSGHTHPALTKENLKEVVDSIPNRGISARSRELLDAIAALASTPGSTYKVELDKDESLAWTNSSDELLFHLQSLIECGWIRQVNKYTDGSKVSLTPLGWNVIEEGKHAQLTRAFVAMSFSKEMEPVWVDGLRPGIINAGYEPHRVDTDPHIGRIDLKILGDIRQSRFVVADATEQKQGVYYEAGFAEALGKPVIWTVRASEIEKVHFDTRQFAHIMWKTSEELASKLEGVILGVLGRGTIK